MTTGLGLRELRLRHAVHDLALFLARRIADLHHEHEAVDLRLGQRVGALLLDRVLRRHDDERLGQRVGLVADGDLPLLHRLEERALHLGGRAVDLVGEDEVGEDGPELGGELALLLVVDHRPDEVGRQEVGRELDARELGVDGVAQRAHGERLGEAGDALEQDVAPRSSRPDEDPLDHVLLAHDDLADLVRETVDEGAFLGDELVEGANVVHGVLSLARLVTRRRAGARGRLSELAARPNIP